MIKIKIILLLKLALQPQHVDSFLQSHGIRARVEVIRLADDLELGTQRTYFDSLRKAFTRKKGEHIHILTNPFLDAEGTEFMLGYAAKTDRVSFSVWNSENSAGEQREIHSWKIMLHEIGHNVFRLSHSTGCISVMDADVGRCSNIAQLGFTKQELRRMK